MDEPVTISLSRDEAVVFFDWLVRFNALDGNRFADQCEQRVLYDLEASLETQLPEPFATNYAQLLAAARGRLRDSTE